MFYQIPNTPLEIASYGQSQNRMIVIRNTNEHDPVTTVTNARILLIGNAKNELQKALRNRDLSRPILGEVMKSPMNGSTYSKLYKYVMDK